MLIREIFLNLHRRRDKDTKKSSNSQYLKRGKNKKNWNYG